MISLPVRTLVAFKKKKSKEKSKKPEKKKPLFLPEVGPEALAEGDTWLPRKELRTRPMGECIRGELPEKGWTLEHVIHGKDPRTTGSCSAAPNKGPTPPTGLRRFRAPAGKSAVGSSADLCNILLAGVGGEQVFQPWRCNRPEFLEA